MITLAAITFTVGILAFSGILLVHVIKNYYKDKKARLRKFKPLHSAALEASGGMPPTGLITAEDYSTGSPERREAV